MAVVVVEWSVGLPSTLTIPVRIQLKPTIFSVKNLFEKNENKQEKRLWLAHLKRKTERKKERREREKAERRANFFLKVLPRKFVLKMKLFLIRGDASVTLSWIVLHR